MRFLELQQRLKGYGVFTLSDIKSFEPNFHLSRLTEWQEKSYIKKLIRGKYIFSDSKIDESFLFLVANELMPYSYVSMESALSWHSLIPEGVRMVTSVSTKKNTLFNTSIGNFDYRKIKPKAFIGFDIVDIPNLLKPYKIASIEKAILDFLHFRYDIDNFASLEELRIDDNLLREKLNLEKMESLLSVYESKALDKRYKNFIRYFYKND